MVGEQVQLTTREVPRAEATAAIANLGNQDFYVSRTYGIFHIPACAKGEAYALLLITPLRGCAGSGRQSEISVYDFGARDCGRHYSRFGCAWGFCVRGSAADGGGVGCGAGQAGELVPKFD